MSLEVKLFMIMMSLSKSNNLIKLIPDTRSFNSSAWLKRFPFLIAHEKPKVKVR